MALVKCKECGNDVSTDAATCPKCGAKRAKATSKLTWIVGGFFALVITIGIIQSNGSPSAPAAPSPEKTKADKERDQRTIAAASAMKVLKSSLRDPKSVEWESARTNDTGTLVCISYRARNGFGGMNAAHLVVADGRATESSAEWNKRCTPTLNNVTDGALQLLEIAGT